MPKALLNGINFYYEVHGEGYPLLLLHGFAGTTKSWEPQVAPLSEVYRFIHYDMRGHGQSDSPEELSDYSMETVVEDQYQLLRHLGVAKGVIGGLSLGGVVAMDFYFKYPEMVRALILANTGPGFRNPQHMESWNRSRTACAEILEEEGMEGFMRSHYSLLDYYTTPDVMRKHNPIGLANVNRGVMLDLVMHPIDKIKVPTLILCGDRDIDFLPATEYMSRRVPSSRKVLLQDAGHGSNIDQPDAFNSAILEFLKEIGL